MELDTVKGQFTPAIQDLLFIMRTLFAKIGVGKNWAPDLDGVFRDA
jgi:hypothetical protein